MAAKSTSQTLSALKRSLKSKARADLAETLFKSSDASDLANVSLDHLGEVVRQSEKALKKSRSTLEVSDIGSDKALVLVCMSNRPFIFDSLLAELSEANAQLELVSHPVFETKNGKRSLVAIIIHNNGPVFLKNLKAAVKGTMGQVRHATDDWRKMLTRITDVVSEFRTAPPPLPSDQLAEGIQFLQWLRDDNFIFMGMRQYSWKDGNQAGDLQPDVKSALGILRNPDIAIMTRAGKPVVVSEEIRAFINSETPLIITKANVKTRVHRRAYLDYVGVKQYDEIGRVVGELRIVGLFTSTAYTRSVLRIPYLRHKANNVLQSFGADPASHTGKALVNILETWPRDELFQIDDDTLDDFVRAALKLEERPRIRVLSRTDRFDRFVSVMVYVPRGLYDSDARQKIGDHLAQVYKGRVSAWYPQFLENGLTRVHFIIGRDGDKTPVIANEKLEEAVTSITRSWTSDFDALVSAELRAEFPVAYQEHFEPEEALLDLEFVNNLEDEAQVGVDFQLEDQGTGNTTLKLFHLNEPIALSQRVPILENLGFHAIDESSFEIARHDGKTVYLHTMHLEHAEVQAGKIDELRRKLSDCMNAIWHGDADNDRFNGLVLACGFDWQQASVFRALASYLLQIKSGFSPHSMAETLIEHSAIAGELADLFSARFDPSIKARNGKQDAREKNVVAMLENVSSSDDDRIIRNFMETILAVQRTNFFQSGEVVGEPIDKEPLPKAVLAFKIDPSAISIMPKPVPYREIFVSSPLVDGLHLRFGPVARGGLRWSDRAQDYRTEVLGLVKAQQVKNAVIVPVGSKGGFYPKQLPTGGDRNLWFEAGRQAYRVFITSLLSVTDNLVNNKVVSPENTVRHDGDDPYFVVAADKGTATFSDTANAISQGRDFWLDDAFASGGSAGYDHKKMGITARGGWEAVKRHFREMDRDIQTQPFTTVGVGDMSGDVYGNGMLLSKQTKVIAAFDHRDIFVDPDPDVATSFKERKRLFDKGRSSWQDYNRKKMSKGGDIFPRNSKSIKLSKEAAQALGMQPGTMTPNELMRGILKSPVDLIWFGGIGTYIKAGFEPDAEVGDRANDAIRIRAKDVRAKVIGEGANLGVTQDGRIAFNLLGGRCNSDAVDNSAGVNSSDVEVNIKIALAAAMKSGRLTRPKRNKLLESMTEEVAELVLRNNYLQTLAISLTERSGMDDLAHQQRLMQSLEARDLLDRAVENLPDDMQIAERSQRGEPLTRAEIGVLLAYAKIVALDDLMESAVPDDSHLERELVTYFPTAMRKTYSKEISEHRLRREIIGTVLVNSMVNRGGPTFISRIQNRTGASLDKVAQAYAATRDAFDLQSIGLEIDALDNRISGDLQLELYDGLRERVEEQGVWFARYGDFSKGIGPVAARYRGAVDSLAPKLEKIIPDFLQERVAADAQRFAEGGVPNALAQTLARLPIAALIPDIQLCAESCKASLDTSAKAFFDVTNAFQVGKIVQAARGIDAEDFYDDLALDRALQSLHAARRSIVNSVLTSKSSADKWLDQRSDLVSSTRRQMADIVDREGATVSRLTVAANILGDLARAG